MANLPNKNKIAAEQIETEFKKGSFVSIEGKLVSKSYTDKNGQNQIDNIKYNDSDIRKITD